MKLKKVLQTTLATVFAVTTLAGVGLLQKQTTAADSVVGAEWAVGNENVTATFGFDYKIGEKDYSAWKPVDTAYAEAKPILYQTPVATTNNSIYTINLGYYNSERDFSMAWMPVQDCVKNSYSASDPYDFYGVRYIFTNTKTGKAFKVELRQWQAAATRTKGEAYWYNEEDTRSGGPIYPVCSFGGGYSSSGSAPYYDRMFKVSYNREANYVDLSTDASKLGFTISGIDPYETYKVDLAIERVQQGKSAKIAVYNLNGYSITDQTLDTLQSNGVVMYQGADTIKANDGIVKLSDVASAWDSVAGDISSQLTYAVKDAQGNPVAISNGAFEAVTGTYTVTATYGETTKSYEVAITVPPAATAEWATGNAKVKVTHGFDITNSNYGQGGDTPGYWRPRAYDSTNIALGNSALAAENFWYKSNYENLTTMFYETVANATNPSINLGYYNDDFGISITPVQSSPSNAHQGYMDYWGVVYKFTDVTSGETFSVRIRHTGGNETKAKIGVSVNGGDYQGETFFHGSMMGRFNGTLNSAESGIFYIQHLKYDVSENKIKFNRDLSVNLDLSAYGLTKALENYKVDLSFYNILAGKTAKLCVYYLNGYDLTTETKYTLDDNTHNEVIYATETNVQAGTVDLNNIVKAYSSYAGDVSNLVAYTVENPNGDEVTVENGKFDASLAGAYTVTATYGNATKEIALNVTFPEGGIVVKKASLNLEGKIGVMFLVSADNALYNADGGKVIFTVAGETVEVPFAEWKAYGNDYIVEVKVAAKQMADVITMNFVDKNGIETAEVTYSVAQYANTVLANEDSSAELVALVKAMLNYGAYAQVYFNYNVENLANAGLYAEGQNPVELKDGVTAANVTVDGTLEAVTLKSLSLILETETEIAVLFTLADGVSIEDVEIKLGDVVLETVQKGNAYYVIIPNVAAKDIDNAYALTVTYNNVTVTYAVSAQAYVSAAYGATDNVAYNNVLKAIELYNVAANTYFAD